MALKYEITYTVTAEPEPDLSPEDFFDSGDTKADAALRQDIYRRIERGDVWAWAIVTVTASVEVNEQEFEGSDSLCACSYDNEDAFRQPGGYFDDMKRAALAGLCESLKAAENRGVVASELLGAMHLDGVYEP